MIRTWKGIKVQYSRADTAPLYINSAPFSKLCSHCSFSCFYQIQCFEHFTKRAWGGSRDTIGVHFSRYLTFHHIVVSLFVSALPFGFDSFGAFYFGIFGVQLHQLRVLRLKMRITHQFFKFFSKKMSKWLICFNFIKR